MLTDFWSSSFLSRDCNSYYYNPNIKEEIIFVKFYINTQYVKHLIEF